MKKIILGVVVLSILVFAGFRLLKKQKSDMNFRTQTVTRGEVVEWIIEDKRQLVVHRQAAPPAAQRGGRVG